jgi:hypothetical protein
MKPVALIISFYLFALCIIPCTDNVTCGEEITTEMSDNHDHSNDAADNCTMFCTCNCCGISFTAESFHLLLEINVDLSNTTNSFYSCVYNNGYLDNIWQPPNLS